MNILNHQKNYFIRGLKVNNVKFINDAYTKDSMRLPMVHYSTIEKDICVIFVHGMCQTIIDNYFAIVCGNLLSENKNGLLYKL